MNPEASVILQLAASQTVGVVLLLAGLVKVFDRGGTIDAVLSYEIVPVRVARVVAVVLPWLELAAAVSLGSGVATLAGAGLAAGLFLVFVVAQTTALARGKLVPCGCFGSASDDVVSWGKVAANATLAAICVGLLASEVLGGGAVNPSLRIYDQFWVRVAVTLLIVHYWSVRQILENRRIAGDTGFPAGIAAAESAA